MRTRSSHILALLLAFGVDRLRHVRRGTAPGAHVIRPWLGSGAGDGPVPDRPALPLCRRVSGTGFRLFRIRTMGVFPPWRAAAQKHQ